MTNINVTAEELAYVDRQAGNDKFYRVFQFDNLCVVQYGRNGTFGTFKRTTCVDEAAAVAAAKKQGDAKFKKGYERVKTAVLQFSAVPTDSQLDVAMGRAAHQAEASDAGERQAANREAAVAKLNDFDAAPVNAAVMAAVHASLDNIVGTRPAHVAAVAVGAAAVRPMLAESSKPGSLETLIVDDRWVAQQKLDGERMVVECVDGQVAVYNRQGQPKTSNVAENILAPFRNLTEGRWVFDGEVVGRKLWLFDMIAAGPYLADDAHFDIRYAALEATVAALDVDATYVGLVVVAAGVNAKQALYDDVVAQSREGVIFRKVAARYQPGRRSLDMLKHKMLKEADCFVTAVGVKGKENASVAVFDVDGNERVVGSVSTIGKGPIAVGDVVEVQFLYVVDGDNPRMFQPRIVGVRTDKAADECSIAQFANAGTNKAL